MVAGKTTAAKTLNKTFRKTLHHSEINQYTLIGGFHPGGAFVDLELEEKIIKADLLRLKKITLDKRSLIHLIETDIFHCLYMKILGDEEKTARLEEEYKKYHQKFKTGLLFVDTKPQISWARRRNYYLKRTLSEIKKRDLKGVEAKKFRDKRMRKYQQRIFNLYPLWLEMFENLSYPKIKIPNNGKSLEVFKKKIISGFLKLIKAMKISIEA